MRGCAVLALGFVAAAGLAACWQKRPPRPPDETVALQIAGEVYGVNFLPAKPPQLTVHYVEPNCTTPTGEAALAGQTPGVPGFVTWKGNCVVGVVAPWSPQVNIVGWPGRQRFSDPGFCEGTWQAYEIANLRAPREESPGEAEKIAECKRRLRAAGL